MGKLHLQAYLGRASPPSNILMPYSLCVYVVFVADLSQCDHLYLR